MLESVPSTGEAVSKRALEAGQSCEGRRLGNYSCLITYRTNLILIYALMGPSDLTMYSHQVE